MNEPRLRFAIDENLDQRIVTHQKAPIGAVVADLELVALAVDPGELVDQVWFLPFAS